MTKKLAFMLLAIQILLLAVYFIDTDYRNTNRLKSLSNGVEESARLSDENVTAFAQDRMHQMWIGSRGGLNVYCGDRYKHLFCVPGDSTTIPDDNVQSLLCDSRGQMWVGTPHGVARHIGWMKFKRYALPSTARGIYQMSDYGERGVLATDGVDAYLIHGDTVSHFYHFERFFENSTFVYADRQGGFWIIQPMLVRHFDGQKRLLASYKREQANVSSSYRQGDTVWYNQSHYVAAIDLKSNRMVYDTGDKLPIIPTAIYQRDKHCVLLCSAYHGLYMLDTRTRQLTKVSEQELLLRHKDVTISTMYRDDSGNVWVGYQYGGCQVVSGNSMAMERCNNLPINTMTRGRAVTCIGQAGSGVVGSLEDKVFYYDAARHTYNEYLYKDIFSDSPFFRQTLECVIPCGGDSAWLVSNVRILSCLLRDGRIDVVSRVYSRYHTGPLLGCGIRYGRDALVASSSPYILRARFGSNVCDSICVGNGYYGIDSKLLLLPNGRVLVVMKGMRMALYDPERGTVEQLRVAGNEQMGNADPSECFIDSKRRIWIGTRHGGLCRFDVATSRLTKYDDMTLSDIQSIQEDRWGRLWVCSRDELAAICPDDSTTHFYAFDRNDTEHRYRYYRNSCTTADGNNLILGTSNGCLTVPLAQLKERRRSKLAITDLSVNTRDGRQYGVKSSFADGQRLRFASDENDITIEYADMDYDANEQMMYQCIMEGVDARWSAPSLRTRAKYARLAPGRYTFRVRLVSGGNGAPKAETSLRISIKPSLAQSAAAYYFYVVAFMFAVYYLQSLYLRNQKNRLRMEQLEAERQRDRKTNEMNMNFFANISHEFRNPLTLISGPLMMLKQDNTLPSATRRTLNLVCTSINRMLRLIDQMLDFNKIETDALRLSVANDDIVGRMQSLMDLFAESARLRGVDVEFVHPDANLYGWIDSDKLEKIMSNLLTNALKHTPEHGRVRVEVGLRTDGKAAAPSAGDAGAAQRLVDVSVYNNGKHIDADKMDNIFKRYYQVSGTQATHSYGWGTGIGLYYVKRLVQLHHGRIWVSNQPQGGVTFAFTLPIDRDAYTADELSQAERHVAYIPIDPQDGDVDQMVRGVASDVNRTARKPTVLVVDDDIAVAQYIRSLFADDYQVVNKYSAEAALAEMESIKPDIVLSDVIMDNMDGYTFCRTLKQDLMTCHIPVVLITAKAKVSEQVEGLGEGANAYVTKPFDPRYLKAVVKSLLANMDMLRKKLTENCDTAAVTDGLAQQDRQFLDQLYASMEKHLSEQDINVATISQELLISHSKLNYKLKELTGETPGSFFRKYKLNVAARMLREGQHNVSEVAYLTGFGTASYFSVAFKRQFGVSPSDYR